MPWTVYLARCSDGSLYTGITTDPIRRIAEHNRGSGAAYTRTRRPIRLVYWEMADDRSDALRREHAIRRLTRKEKERLLRHCEGAKPRPMSSDGRSSEF